MPGTGARRCRDKHFVCSDCSGGNPSRGISSLLDARCMEITGFEARPHVACMQNNLYDPCTVDGMFPAGKTIFVRPMQSRWHVPCRQITLRICVLLEQVILSHEKVLVPSHTFLRASSSYVWRKMHLKRRLVFRQVCRRYLCVFGSFLAAKHIIGMDPNGTMCNL